MFTPTSEQRDILDAVDTGEDVVVDALAGTGKTTTSREATKRAVARRRVMCMYFNRAAKEEAERSFPTRNTTVTTTYSLAYREVRRTRYSELLNKLNAGYVPVHVTIRGLGIGGLRVGDASINASTIAVATLQVLDDFCNTTGTEITADLFRPLPNYSDKVNAEIRAAVMEYAAAGWKDLLTPHGNSVQFDHKHYKKLWGSGMATNGEIPRMPGLADGDLLIYDEAQDADPLMASVVAAQTHLQRLYIGDECQAINRFAGAVNAMRSFDATHRLPLTESWRFGQRVADAANVFLEALQSPHRVKGNPNRDTHITDAYAADTVLCRTNAGTIGEVLSLQEAGHKVAVVGGVKEARRFAVACAQLQRGQPNSHPELSMFRTWDSLVEYVELLDKPTPLSTVVKVVKKYTADSLIEALDNCVDEKSGKADVHCSTAHKAKGGEWNRVRMADDFDVSLTPTSPTSTDEDVLDMRDNQMLAYVAVTRGMQSVNVGSLYDDNLARRPAVSVAAATIEHAAEVAKNDKQLLNAPSRDLAAELINRLPVRLGDDVHGLLRASGVEAHELIRRALASYTEMHAWG